MTDHFREPLPPRRLPPGGRAPHQFSSRWTLLVSLLFMTVVETMMAVTIRRWEFVVSAVLFLAAAVAGWRALPIPRDAPHGGRDAPARTVPGWGVLAVVLVVGGFVFGALGTR
ncbi:hypothetical protein [Raineyella fluvialis]|uniref:Uncharacterized protein n=1 Tax=Raineyella fluvialis TaxID=2662261 RepID=A0A5Q2FDN9_9ACTN|nr:hypothetical protein [Raineyella fluvialis]QGF23223.1 hypothetical protein Rai3103_05605 [Raineyella fluvialis]